MATTTFVRARVDEKIKNDAAAVLADLGLTVSDVVRMALTRVAIDKAIPTDLKVPNAETIAAMEESRKIMKSRKSRFKSAEEMFAALDNDRK